MPQLILGDQYDWKSGKKSMWDDGYRQIALRRKDINIMHWVMSKNHIIIKMGDPKNDLTSEISANWILYLTTLLQLKYLNTYVTTTINLERAFNSN